MQGDTGRYGEMQGDAGNTSPRRHMGRAMQAKTAGVPEMHAARGGGEKEATDDRGRAKSEAPDLELALWQNEAHRKKRR